MEFIIIHLPMVDSTLNEARRYAFKGAKEGTVVRADTQTSGRGRSGRTWHSDDANNLYFSLILEPQYDYNKSHMVTLIVAMAVNNAIRKITGLDTLIKWPNDIVYNGKKICGILTELYFGDRWRPFQIPGVGINVSRKEFPEEIKNTATSLFVETGVEYNMEEILDCILKEFDPLYKKFLENITLDFLKEDYEKVLANKEKGVRVLDPKEPFEGIAKGIDSVGALQVLTENGEIKSVSSGEVSVRGIYGYV